MKNIQKKNERIYGSPQTQILKVESESVLCSSVVTDEVTGLTGANWWEGKDAEW